MSEWFYARDGRQEGPVSLEKLTEIARCDALTSKTWNPPTLAGRFLILRNDREAVCLELPAK